MIEFILQWTHIDDNIIYSLSCNKSASILDIIEVCNNYKPWICHNPNLTIDDVIKYYSELEIIEYKDDILKTLGKYYDLLNDKCVKVINEKIYFNNFKLPEIIYNKYIPYNFYHDNFSNKFNYTVWNIS
jgi:hypothetical protein